VAFNRKTGMMESIQYQGKELIIMGPAPNFWRPVTDNDFGNKMHQKSKVWRYAGNKRHLTAFNTKKMKGAVRVDTRYDLKDVQSELILTYQIMGSGDMLIRYRFVPGKKGLPEIPVIGLNMQLPKAFVNVDWFGRGPHENYWDRKTGTPVGYYSSKVSDLYFPYISPQENGNRSDIRWVSFTDSSGMGLLVAGMPLINFSALHYSNEDMDREYRGSLHTVDLAPREEVCVDIDYQQRGVAGDDSWWAMPYPQYRLEAREYTYTFRLRPFSALDDPAALARQKFGMSE
jgi:beta-galactosidase